MIWAGKSKFYFFIFFILLLTGGVYFGGKEARDRTTQPKVKPSSFPINVPQYWYEDKAVSYPLPEFAEIFSISEGYKLDIELRTNKIKMLKPGAYWCGAPFYADYEGKATAKIINNDRLTIDELELTSPTLVLGTPPHYDYYYYKPYDLDGDGEKREFILLRYSSCNGNFLKVVRVDKKEKKFKSIPFALEENLVEEVMVDPKKEDFSFANGHLRTTSYDIVTGKFYKNVFEYEKGLFKRIERFWENL